MFTPTARSRAAALVAALALPLSVAACGTSSTAAPAAEPPASAPMSSAPMEPSSPMSSAPMESASPSASGAAMSKPFGPGCAAVPTSGKGSFDGMSSDPVATAASNNPALSTLVTAVKAAGLVDTLNNAQDITVFAPTNDAFAKVDKATLGKALKDPKGLLTSVLTAHVVSGRLSPEQVAGTHPTLNKSQPVKVTGSGESFTVNGSASVVCGNVQTANATVYLIDEVLLPTS